MYLTERYVRSIGMAAALNELEGFTDCIERGDAEGAVDKLSNCMQEQLERYRHTRA